MVYFLGSLYIQLHKETAIISNTGLKYMWLILKKAVSITIFNVSVVFQLFQ